MNYISGFRPPTDLFLLLFVAVPAELDNVAGRLDAAAEAASLGPLHAAADPRRSGHHT